MSICFIVGHGKSKNGGYDPGAVANGVHEFKIAREIARYATEYYNKNYNESCDIINYNCDKYLTERISAVNASDYDFVAEIHLNAGGGTGTEVYHHNGSTGNRYAEAITAAIAAEFGVKNRGAKTKLNGSGRDYFAIIRETQPTAVLIETLFIDSSDIKHIKTADGQRKCGEAIAGAVAEVRGASRKQVADTTTGKLYRVQVGAFSDRKNAEVMLAKLRNAGFEGFIKSE